MARSFLLRIIWRRRMPVAPFRSNLFELICPRVTQLNSSRDSSKVMTGYGQLQSPPW
jgi:hypothetical protein